MTDEHWYVDDGDLTAWHLSLSVHRRVEREHSSKQVFVDAYDVEQRLARTKEAEIVRERHDQTKLAGRQNTRSKWYWNQQTRLAP